MSNKVYKNSKKNTERIISINPIHEVRFGIDATKLSNYFHDDDERFDRIQFNFPHWKGKCNNRYNRYVPNFMLHCKKQMKFIMKDDNDNIILFFQRIIA